jgi:hypothetical protein
VTRNTPPSTAYFRLLDLDSYPSSTTCVVGVTRDATRRRTRGSLDKAGQSNTVA